MALPFYFYVNEKGGNTMYKIYTPNKHFKGVRLGVEFVNGVGETKDAKVAKDLESFGYKVEKEKPAKEKKSGDE